MYRYLISTFYVTSFLYIIFIYYIRYGCWQQAKNVEQSEMQHHVYIYIGAAPPLQQNFDVASRIYRWIISTFFPYYEYIVVLKRNFTLLVFLICA